MSNIIDLSLSELASNIKKLRFYIFTQERLLKDLEMDL